MYYIIGFLVLGFICWLLSEYILLVILLGIIIALTCYMINLYKKSYGGRLRALNKEEKNQELLKKLTKRLNDSGVYPTKLIKHDLMNQVVYVDENNRLLYFDLLYENFVISADLINNFEVYRGEKQIYKYTLGTSFTGKLKTINDLEDLRLILYINDLNRPMIDINCLSTIYSFNRNDAIYSSNKFINELIGVIEYFNHNKKTKEVPILNLIPEITISKDELKKESFISFVKNYHKTQFKNSRSFRIGFYILVFIITVLLFICGYKLFNNINTKLSNSYINKTLENDDIYLYFTKDLIKVATPTDDGYYRLKEHSYDIESSSELVDTLHVYTTSSYYTCTISKKTPWSFDCPGIDVDSIFEKSHFNFNDLKIKTNDEEYCKNRGFDCDFEIDKNSIYGYYIGVHEDHFNTLYIPEVQELDVLLTYNYNSDLVYKKMTEEIKKLSYYQEENNDYSYHGKLDGNRISIIKQSKYSEDKKIDYIDILFEDGKISFTSDDIGEKYYTTYIKYRDDVKVDE